MNNNVLPIFFTRFDEINIKDIEKSLALIDELISEGKYLTLKQWHSLLEFTRFRCPMLHDTIEQLKKICLKNMRSFNTFTREIPTSIISLIQEKSSGDYYFYSDTICAITTNGVGEPKKIPDNTEENLYELIGVVGDDMEDEIVEIIKSGVNVSDRIHSLLFDEEGFPITIDYYMRSSIRRFSDFLKEYDGFVLYWEKNIRLSERPDGYDGPIYSLNTIFTTFRYSYIHAINTDKFLISFYQLLASKLPKLTIPSRAKSARK